MSFKDDVTSDLAVFVNADEFAEEHNLNGTACLAIVEGLTSKERSARMGGNYEGVCGNVVIVHVAANLLDEVPVHDEIFYLDDKLYYVEDCTNDYGMLTIELRSNSV